MFRRIAGVWKNFRDVQGVFMSVPGDLKGDTESLRGIKECSREFRNDPGNVRSVPEGFKGFQGCSRAFQRRSR